MASGFKRITEPRTPIDPERTLDEAAFLDLLRADVVERFTSLNITPLAVPLVLPVPQDLEEPPSAPCHPACLEYAESDYCRESWLLHMAEIRDRPATHWHRCEYDKLCALVPVVHLGRCLALIKCACPTVMPEDDFARQIELLDLLVKDFVNAHTGLLDKWVTDAPAAGESKEPVPLSGETPGTSRPTHAQVLQALGYIEAHLADPALAVPQIARALEVHPNYLSHLFTRHVGERMSRYIARCRVEKAKHLLTTTHWQVKRIARETGHANANWFTHVFQAHTGLAPSDYRAAARASGGATPER